MDLSVDLLCASHDSSTVPVSFLPRGTATESFRRRGMEKVLAAYRTERNDTGFIYYFTKTGLCRHLEIGPVSPDHTHETARLTLDYDVDLELFRRIFEALYRPGAPFGLAETVDRQSVVEGKNVSVGVN